MAKKNKKKKRSFKLPVVVLLFLLALVLVINQLFDLNPVWESPKVLKSKEGQLNVALTAEKNNVSIGGKVQESTVYNDSYISDTWDIRGGDKVKVHLENKMTDPTNLHFHGGHISPKGNSDNVLLNIKPGENFDYEYNLPATHPPGLYWYHPHLHHYTDSQVMGGMVGAIIVRGNVDELPGIKGVPERLLVLTTQDIGSSTNRLVNNQSNPTLYIRPFETVRMRILNASSDDCYNLAIPGAKLNIISRDGNTLSQVQSVDSEVMAPGDRIEILFKAGAWGQFTVKSLEYNAGSFTYPEDDFMKIKVAGIPVIPKSLPSKLIPYQDLRNEPVVRTRRLIFSEGGTSENTTFLLDGKEFNPNHIDQIMTLGTTEAWELVNNSVDTHPFHIHVNPYQVLSVNGQSVERNGYDDTFPVPAHGSVIIKTQYKDFDGKYVLHCHILFHEDNGMMQLVEMLEPSTTPAPDNGMPDREAMPEMMRMGTGRELVSPSKRHNTKQNSPMHIGM